MSLTGSGAGFSSPLTAASKLLRILWMCLDAKGAQRIQEAWHDGSAQKEAMEADTNANADTDTDVDTDTDYGR